MIDAEYAGLMARYNQWMNRKLYAACATLSDAERRADRGAFFKSIHGTLNHLMFADEAWLRRFSGRSLDGLAIGVELFPDFEAMRARRETLDEDLIALAASFTPAWLAADFSFHSMGLGKTFTRPAWTLVTHLFNHQTHHRGQLTTLMTQVGLEVGLTDLAAMPGFAEPV